MALPPSVSPVTPLVIDASAPAITALELRIADQAASAVYLKNAGVAFTTLSDGRLAVSPAAANGTSLILAAD